jgi:hypothetical protein
VDYDGSFELFKIADLPCGAVERAFNTYPNPAKDLLTVESDLVSKEDISFTIVDLQGRPVLNGNIPAGYLSSVVDISKLPVGAYLIRFEAEGQTFTQQLLKQ